MSTTKSSTPNVTTIVVVVAVVAISVGMILTNNEFFMRRLFPWGMPRHLTVMEDERPILPSTATKSQYANTKLQSQHGNLIKIYERGTKGLLKGPETVFFGPDGTMYIANDHGLLLSLTDLQPNNDAVVDNDDDDKNGKQNSHIWTAKTTIVRDLGVGRPLGAKFTSDGSTLYYCDGLLGLMRIRNFDDPTSKVEIVASKILLNDSNSSSDSSSNGGRSPPMWSTINFADDLTIGPKTGRVYFTDASEVISPRNTDGTIDVMYGSKIDSMKGPSGRLLQYDPTDDSVTILADGIWFANGVGVDVDETYLIVGETLRLGLIKYHLTGTKAGTTEYVVKGDPLNAYIDGVDCAWPGVTVDSTSPAYCYAANPSEVLPAHRILWKIPSPIDWIVKSLLMLLPKELAPHIDQYGGITVVDGTTGSFVTVLQDPTGQDISKLTGVTVHDNKLYLGSLENDFVGVYTL